MPNLVGCSEAEWEQVLPGIARPSPARAGKAKGLDPDLSACGVDMKPLHAYAKAIRKSVANGIIPGFCSIVIWHGRVLHVDAHGLADLELGTPFRTDTLLRMYCATKSIVGTALMLLVEEGRCSLEDDVGTYIPAFRHVLVAPSDDSKGPSPDDRSLNGRLTLRRLLAHCSGLGYGKEFNLDPETPMELSYDRLVKAVESGEVRDLKGFCEALAAWAPLRRDPGTCFEYSYGTDVVGHVIEVISGMPLDAFLRERIFEPLGMHDTAFSVPESKLPRLAGLYGGLAIARQLGEAPEDLPNEFRPKPAWKLYRLDGKRPLDSAWAEGKNCTVLSGGGIIGHNRGGLISTLNDMARFCLMLYHGGCLPAGGRRILREETVRGMLTCDWLALPGCIGEPQVSDGGTGGVAGITARGRFGWNAVGELGMNEDQQPADAFEADEYGYGGIAETYWSVNPRRGLIILWFSQQVDNHSWSSDVANLWLAARAAVAKAKEPTSSKRRRITRKTKPQ